MRVKNRLSPYPISLLDAMAREEVCKLANRRLNQLYGVIDIGD